MTALSPSLVKLDALLRDANGMFVPGQTLAKAVGVPVMNLGNFIRQLRIERPGVIIEGMRGAGYRMVPATAPTIETQKAELFERMADILLAANGKFVTGGAIAARLGVEVKRLSSLTAQLRTRRPDLIVEGRHGSGYSARLAVAPAPALPPIPDPPHKPHAGGGRACRPAPAAFPLHKRMAAAKALLDLLPPRAAEIVKNLALQSGESVDETTMRLIDYGQEVHNDLVASGENPVGLRAPRASDAAVAS